MHWDCGKKVILCPDVCVVQMTVVSGDNEKRAEMIDKENTRSLNYCDV